VHDPYTKQFRAYKVISVDRADGMMATMRMGRWRTSASSAMYTTDATYTYASAFDWGALRNLSESFAM
jgi:hypothetical protein